jgi:hypothetical protein
MVLAAGTARAHAWHGNLAALAAAPVPEALRDAPGTIVVGEVAALAATIAAAPPLPPRLAAPRAATPAFPDATRSHG